VTVFGLVTNRQLLQAIQILASKVDILMSQQDEIGADVQAIEGAVAQLNAAASAIEAEIAALQQANPALDLSGLQQAVADLGTAASAVAAIPPAPAQ
jgi:predicted  nucleic acid-binding Zn-ribbon protein